MGKLFEFLNAVYKPRYEEDLVDRLNYRVTGTILIIAALVITGKTYVGAPIQCWVPAQFTDGWEQYVENYCFVENTYWVPREKEIPTELNDRDERQISYYQWVPFVLAVQALMFGIPYIIWQMLNSLSGIQVRAIITTAKASGDTALIAAHLRAGFLFNANNSLSTSSSRFAWIIRGPSWLAGSYITITYLMMKVLFIVNCILQFVLLNAFLGTQYNSWGIHMLSDLIAGRTWFSTGHFPRVTMCDFEVRQLGNLHRWSVQCVLMINMFNEKIYLFLWWWFLVVTIVTILNFIYWLFVSSIGSQRKAFLQRLLNCHSIDVQSREDRAAFDRFADQLLRSDGVVVLRLLTRNVGELFGSRVVGALWDMSKDDLIRQSKPSSYTDGFNNGKYSSYD